MAARKSKTTSSRSQPKKNNSARRTSSDGRTRNSAKSARSRNTRAASSRNPNGAMARTELDRGKLVEFLSQMLAVEKGGVMLYEKALEELSHEELRDSLEQFLEQTCRHVELCEEMLDRAGASADENTPASEAAEAKAKGLISVEVPEEMNDFNNIENLVLAETKDHWNWETLSEISKSIKERELRSTVSRAVREVSRQERRHVDWNTSTLSELAREMMRRHRAEQAGEEEGEEIEEHM
jgi:rubrerythrin